MEALIPFLANLLAGAAGGNVAGALFKKLSLGVMGNMLAGLVGGGVAGQLLTGVTGGQGALAFGPLLAEILTGGAGGVVCTLVVGWIRQYVAK